MNLDNFVTFSRPQSGTMIIQLMTELDVSNKLKPETAIITKLFRKQNNAPFFTSKIACHNAQILKIYKRQ